MQFMKIMKTEIKLLLLFCVIMPYNNAIVTMDSDIDDFVETPRNGSTTILTVMAMVNYGGDSYPVGPLCTKAIQIALNQLAKDDNWLPNYSLRFLLFDDQCNNSLTVGKVVESIQSNLTSLPMLFFSGCSTTIIPIASEVMKNFNNFGVCSAHFFSLFVSILLQFSFATGETTATPKTNGAMFPLVYSDFDQDLDFIRVLQKFHWSQVALFSENEHFFNGLTEAFLPWLGYFNVSILAIAKPSHLSESVEEMEFEMKRLKQVEARIIINHSDSPVALSCWMYRLGMFGPEFVIIGSVWSEFEPDTVDIPGYIRQWCTKKILAVMIENWIFVGQGSNIEIFGESFKDSTGLSETDFFTQLDLLVANGSTHPDRDWAPKCYDVALFMGFVIGKTERSIRVQQNGSLSDLIGPKQNSLSLSSIITNAIYGTKVLGQKGVYHFERKTKANTKGYVPIIFYQKFYNSSTILERKAVGYVGNFEEGVIELNQGFKFRTKNGKPPTGLAKIIVFHQPKMNTIEYWVLISISIVFVACAIAGNAVGFKLHPIQCKSNSLTTAGIVILLCHSFANPSTSTSNFAINCSIILIFDSLGFVLVWLGFYIKIHSISDMLKSELGYLHRSLTKGKKLLVAFLASCLVLFSSIACGLGVFTEQTTWGKRFSLTSDKSTVYQSKQRFCSLKESSTTAFGLLIGTFIIAFLISVEQIYKSYKSTMHAREIDRRIHNRSKKLATNQHEARIVFNGILLTGIVLAGAVLLAILRLDDPYWLHVLSNVVAIIFSVISYCIIMIPMFHS